MSSEFRDIVLGNATWIRSLGISAELLQLWCSEKALSFDTPGPIVPLDQPGIDVAPPYSPRPVEEIRFARGISRGIGPGKAESGRVLQTQRG
jgi:hypothetical protein